MILVSLIIISCSDFKDIKNYDELGNLISSYEIKGSDTLKKIELNNSSLSVSLHDSYLIKKDTIFEYFKNGNISLKIVPIESYYFYIEKFLINGDIEVSGFIKNNNRFKWWKSYNNNKLFRQDYYITINDSLNVTESILFQKNGLIDEARSDFLHWSIPDTLFKGDNELRVRFNKRGENGGSYIGIGYDIHSNFKNIQNVKIDSFYSDKNEFEVLLRFTDSGKKTIRGFIYEFFLDSMDYPTKILTAKRYFEKEFYIIGLPDSIPKDKVMRDDK